MKALLTASLALLVLLSGCTPPSAPTTPGPASQTAGTTPLANPSGSPSALAAKDIPLAPKQPSAFDVVLSDPGLLVRDASEPWGPMTFAVLGNTVMLEDSVDDGMITYTDGRRTGRGRLDTDGWVVVDDLLGRGSELYVLQGDGDTSTNRKVHVYSRGTGGALIPTRVLPGEFIRGNGPASIYFAGPNVVGWSFADPDVLLDGPGPVPEWEVDVNKKVYTVALPGTAPLRFHVRHAEAGIDLLRVDDEYAYFLVEEQYGYAAYVYRISLTSAGSDASYTLADCPGYTPHRMVQVSDGQVFQLRSTSRTVQVLRLHPNS